MADYNIGDIMWGASSSVVMGLYYPQGLQGSANAHTAFYDAPSTCAVFQDGHSDYITDIAGIGGKNDFFDMLP